MKNVYLKKSKRKKKLLEFKIDGVPLKLKGTKNQNIEKMLICDSEWKDEIIANQFQKKIKRLLTYLESVLSGETSGDINIVLDEVAKLQSVLDHKLAKKLSQQKMRELQKEILLTNKRLNKQIQAYNYNRMLYQTYLEETNKRQKVAQMNQEPVLDEPLIEKKSKSR